MFATFFPHFPQTTSTDIIAKAVLLKLLKIRLKVFNKYNKFDLLFF